MSIEFTNVRPSPFGTAHGTLSAAIYMGHNFSASIRPSVGKPIWPRVETCISGHNFKYPLAVATRCRSVPFVFNQSTSFCHALSRCARHALCLAGRYHYVPFHETSSRIRMWHACGNWAGQASCGCLISIGAQNAGASFLQKSNPHMLRGGSTNRQLSSGCLAAPGR